MGPKSKRIQGSCLVLAVILHTSLTKSTKSISRPVHEVINEQSRSDVIDKGRYVSAGPGVLEYGNPLAGNSKVVAAQKARIHTQNQQAMFLAEKNRQQRALSLRYQTSPQPDSYMKAYHESQEKHHLDLENRHNAHRIASKLPNINTESKTQGNLRQTKVPDFRPLSAHVDKPNMRRLKQKPSTVFSNPDIIKITTDDAVSNKENNRNHRSQGSMYVLKLDPHHYANPDRVQSIFVTASPSYGDQGVTIKPHSNIGINYNGESIQPTPESSQLFTEAIPSNTQVIYPKQYTQMQGYKSGQELNALNYLLTKNSHDQLSGLNSLLHTSSGASPGNEESIAGNYALEQPIDLFFYAKDHSNPSTPRPVAVAEYKHYQNPYKYGAVYSQGYAQNELFHPVVKDHTPITEQVEDIADPNKHTKLKTYGIQGVLASTEEPKETTTTTANNYYKVEVASQVITGNKTPIVGYYGSHSPNQYVPEDESEKYIQNTKDLVNHGTGETYVQADVHHDESEQYLHHNPKGIHPLSSEYETEDNLHYASNYEFGYRVRDHHTGNDFGHHEAKDGDKTKGQYHVLLPDGRLQNVKYVAGPEGFHAHVSYDHA